MKLIFKSASKDQDEFTKPSSCSDCSISRFCLGASLMKEESFLNEYISRGRLVDKGEFLYRQGETLTSLYVIKSGSFKTLIESADESKQVIGFHLPSEILALSALEMRKFKVSAIALEKSTICELPISYIIKTFERSPQALMRLINLMSRKICQYQRAYSLSNKKADEKLNLFFSEIGSRYKARGYSDKELPFSMTKNDIASYLGLAPETVSRTFSNMQKNGKIKLEGTHVTILIN